MIGAAEVEVTRSVYQAVVAAYRDPDRPAAKAALTNIIASQRRGVPADLVEIAKLGATLTRRARDVLAYFDRRHTSNGPIEAINGRLEHLRGTALGFRSLTNYIARSLLASPDHYSKPATSDLGYTLHPDEPHKRSRGFG